MRVAEQKTSNGTGMYEEYKGTENNDETDEIRSDDRVWETCGNDKRMVCADNQNVEIYKKQLNN